MRLLLVAGLLAASAAAAATFAVVDARGAVASDVARCPGAAPSRVEVREAAAPEARLHAEVWVVNPGSETLRFHGGLVTVESWRLRYDGRLEPSMGMTQSADFVEGYDGTDVPPGGEVRWAEHRVEDPEAGTYVLRAHVDDLCGVGRARAR